MISAINCHHHDFRFAHLHKGVHVGNVVVGSVGGPRASSRSDSTV